jgi:leader peptidase (prepilin peptidase) / N-methyltransferase
MSTEIIIPIVFIFGACIGSFLNVCVYRIPISRSIVKPGSMCPRCQSSIRFYDNIPILSYLWLMGKCRRCGEKISIRYPIIEMLTGFLACICFIKFGYSLEFIIYFAFITILLVISFIDLDYKIIPDIISLPAIPIGLLTAWIVPSITFIDAFIGTLLGGGILYFIAWTYQMITGKEGMGGGDIKLLAMIGAFIGWKGVLVTIFIASASGTIVGILLMLIAHKNIKYAVPFGPFLAIGAVIYVFIGSELIHWYYGFSMVSGLS